MKAVDIVRFERLPGEAGPLLRARGPLAVESAAELRRELEELAATGHDTVLVDLTEARYLDAETITVLLTAAKRLHGAGRRLALIGGDGTPARLLQVLGIDWIIPVFPSEQVAMLALRGGGPPPPAPATWEEAREATLERWKLIRAALEDQPAEEVVRQVTGMFALCWRAEEAAQESGQALHARCEACPLYHALGAREEDLGCASVLEPIIEATRGGDKEAATALMDRLMDLLAGMDLDEAAQGRDASRHSA